MKQGEALLWGERFVSFAGSRAEAEAEAGMCLSRGVSRGVSLLSGGRRSSQGGASLPASFTGGDSV